MQIPQEPFTAALKMEGRGVVTKGVFIHRADSIYDDSPAERYQFPASYLKRAEKFEGDWVVYFEPVKVPASRGFFAVAKVAAIIPDPKLTGMFQALIEPGSYLEFSPTVPRRMEGQIVERDCPNAQWAVRPLSNEDFNRIISVGLSDEDVLPRVDQDHVEDRVAELRTSFQVERTMVQSLVSRPFRDRAFRRAVLEAYDARCAVTGWKLINGGGRAEAEAAHIRPVEYGGPDSIQNGVALSGTAHWMFDRGLIGFSDELEILISRQVNDRSSLEAIINNSGKALAPERAALRPHPVFLQWHRDHCFKG